MIGQTISHYRILRRLGGGGMGIVFEAEDLRLGRRVALKFLPDRLCGDPSALERFQREARATSLLNHPNICTIYDIEDYEDRPFIVMELLEGESLKDRIEAVTRQGIDGGPGHVPNDQLLDIAVQVADGLDAAHSQGIIHRDIKPANIFMTRRGQAKILDFGLAKLTSQLACAPEPPVHKKERVGASAGRVDADLSSDTSNNEAGDGSGLTAAGSIPGTTAYMSPEQVRGDELDARSDLFSFGVVLYEAATGRKPFSGSTSVLTMSAIADAMPVSPLSLNPTLPPAFEDVIGKALAKRRELRYQSAAEFRSDLQRLKRELEPELSGIEQIKSAPTRVFRSTSQRMRWLQLAVAGLIITVAVVLSLWWAKQRTAAVTVSRNSVAVLPFQDMSQDRSQDFLRIALADEVTRILTLTPALEVRPLSSTMKYATGGPPDPSKVARELRVADVVTGHFIRQGENLVVTLEAIDVRRDRLLWQTTLTVPARNMLALERELAGKVNQGLVPVLGGTASGALETATRPRNAEAYDLYLRSAAVPHDPAPNREAIKMLERAVGLDPSYAPAWDALGLRYYYEAAYGGGGRTIFDRATAAYERALALDPNYILAMAHLARNRVERGELVSAYHQAKGLVERRPDNAQAHFTMSYVLRYAGLLEEAAKECDIALGLDPGNYGLRSCALVFAELGRVPRALEYLNLDVGSEFTNNVLPWVLLREGDIAQARQAAARMNKDQTWFGGVLQTCLEPGSFVDMSRLEAEVKAAAPVMLSERDPEFRYLQGSVMAFCGQRELAVKLLRSAIDQDHCSTEALRYDPLLAKLRPYPEFDQLRAAAQECQRKFLVARGMK
ncbi:MAG: protein kinase [Terriglobales bacterium]